MLFAKLFDSALLFDWIKKTVVPRTEGNLILVSVTKKFYKNPCYLYVTLANIIP